MTDIMRSRSVTVKMTPRQAIAAERAIRYCALREEGRTSDQMYGAAAAVINGLSDAGWMEMGGDTAIWQHKS